MTSPSHTRLVKKLGSAKVADRREAIEKLADDGAPEVVPHLYRARRKDEDKELRELATAHMEGLGAIVDLAPIGADQWFEQIKKSSPAFETLCDVMGDRFVGYALIAGAQITGLTIDQLTPSNTVVEFRVGEDGPARSMLLPDFRRQLVEWMLSDTPTTEPVALPVDLALAQRLVGVRYILLAPLHGLKLTRVVIEEAGPAPLAHVIADTDEGDDEIEVTTLRSRLREDVRLELANVRDKPFQLDMGLLDQVDEATETGRWEQVIQLIGGWPGPLSLLLRTPAGAALDMAERARIGRGLGQLALAYRKTGRTAWAEELYRLGLQFVSDGVDGAELFASLGDAMLVDQRFAEAIAPLRRALALGASPKQVGPPLGRAFIRRGRAVAAVAVLELARKAGGSDEEIFPYLRRACDMLGEDSKAWRKHHKEWANDSALSGVVAHVDDDEAGHEVDAEATGRLAGPDFS